MKTRVHAWVVAVGALVFVRAASGQGIRADSPFVTVDPRMDGAASFAAGADAPDEWGDALTVPDSFVDPMTSTTPAGFFYHENKTDWVATSFLGGVVTYPGPTYFVAHDIFGDAAGLFAGFRSNDAGDWNHVKVAVPGGHTVECWCFGGFTGVAPGLGVTDVDEPDDGLWLADAVGLLASSLIPESASPTNLIDDRGFIVRLDGDPASDRHWLPGMPEPGDAGWTWASFYGCFARAGFNGTFGSTETDPDPAHAPDHEVYEWCFHDATAVPPPPPPADPPLPPPLQCLEWRIVMVDPPKRAIIFFAPDWFIHFGFPPVPAVPVAFLAGLAGLLAAGGYLAFRRPGGSGPTPRPARGPARGRGRGTALVLAILVLPPSLCACGGGGGGRRKIPAPINVLIPVFPNGRQGSPFDQQIVVTGQHPPFQVQLDPTPGNVMVPGLNVDAVGRITGVPNQVGTFDTELIALDLAGNQTGFGISIHVDPPMSAQIQPVSVNRTEDSMTISGQVGQELIGVIKITGGDPTQPYDFAPLDPPPVGVQVLPKGVIRGIPTAPGLVVVRVQSNNGGTLQNPFDVTFDIVP